MESFAHHQPMRVAIAHRDAIVACGLQAALAVQKDLEVQRETRDAPLPQSSDVVVCDFDTAIAIAQAGRTKVASSKVAPTRILVFTRNVSELDVRQALSLGIKGCMLSNASLEEVAHGVRTVANGQRYLSESVVQLMAESFSHATLTARETDVLRYLSEGQCNKTIARQLAISVPTVKAHVKAIMGKMNASSRTQAVSVAAQRGLVGLSGHWTS
jgi:DNA-binding NarL/FixJ family response regulator